MAMSFARQILIFIIIWGLLIYVFITKFPGGSSDEQNSNKKINAALLELEKSKQVNNELKLLLDEYVSDNTNNPEQKLNLLRRIESKFHDDSSAQNAHIHRAGEPSLEYEQLRRRVSTNIEEFWSYVHSEVSHVQKTLKNGAVETPELNKQLSNFLSLANEHKRSLLNDFNQMKQNDGYEYFRQKESKDLSELVQRRLHYLQNPPSCASAKKLICRINKGCGYGCQLHHIVYCFIMAYATERTLIMKSKGWRYHKGGWEEIFLPVSETCTDSIGETQATWPGQENIQVLTVPIIDSLNPRPKFLPLAIPADLAPRLMKLHGDPIVWWIGQFLKYILKPQPETQDMITSGLEKLGFKKPIVGVHIRRTDKVGTEAAFHGLEEYMNAVEEYYNQLEMVESIEKRRIFLASDDPKVIEEARKKYPHYDVIGDPEIAKIAAVSTRYTDSSLNGIMLDIDLLSRCDFLVCTFSSQVCRVSYEIMQNFYPDASSRFKSLDDIYYYGGQNAHSVEAVLDHESKDHNQIHMKTGDLVGVAGNHWNGFSKGKSSRTNQVGLFPSFKTNNKVEIAEFPKYSHVDEV